MEEKASDYEVDDKSENGDKDAYEKRCVCWITVINASVTMVMMHSEVAMVMMVHWNLLSNLVHYMKNSFAKQL